MDIDRAVELLCDVNQCNRLHLPSSRTPTFGMAKQKQTGFHQPNKWKVVFSVASSATLRGESCRCSWHPRIPSGVVFGGLRDWAAVLFSAVSYDTVTEEEQPSPDMKWQRRQDACVKNRPPQWRQQTSALRLARMRTIHEESFFQGKILPKPVVITLSITPLNATQAQFLTWSGWIFR